MPFSATEEEALTARIISHARAIYGPNYHKDSTFDVITSGTANHHGIKAYNAWVIVFPAQSNSDYASWTYVLQTRWKESVSAAYQQLLDTLREMMAEVMVGKCKVGVDVAFYPDHRDSEQEP